MWILPATAALQRLLLTLPPVHPTHPPTQLPPKVVELIEAPTSDTAAAVAVVALLGSWCKLVIDVRVTNRTLKANTKALEALGTRLDDGLKANSKALEALGTRLEARLEALDTRMERRNLVLTGAVVLCALYTDRDR